MNPYSLKRQSDLPDSSFAWHYHGYVSMGNEDYANAAIAFHESVKAGHPHPSDRLNRLIALSLAGDQEAALAWAEEGPKENLTATYLAWWGRVAFEANEPLRALSLFQLIKSENGFDGPAWVGDYWAMALKQAKKSRIHRNKIGQMPPLNPGNANVESDNLASAWVFNKGGEEALKCSSERQRALRLIFNAVKVPVSFNER